MKRILIPVLCMLLCLAACVKPVPAPQPTDAPQTEATNPPAAEPTAAPTAEPVAEPTDEPAPAQGEFNPDMVFSGTTLYGEPIGSEQFKDYDLIIVNCWAEWCGPCVGELAEIERIHQEYPNVLILGVLVATNSLEEAKQTLESKGVTYPTLEPTGALVALSERSMYIPATYFFDKNGNELRDEIVGSMDYNGWKETVDSLLG